MKKRRGSYLAEAKPAAFTLPELLAVMSLIAVLAVLLSPALKAALLSAQRTRAASNLRQIGQGLHLYTAEVGTFPGPLWPGQMPQLDPDRTGRLVRDLAPYLSIPIPKTPQVMNLFVPPGYTNASGAPALENARTFVLNMAVPVDGLAVNPWGSLAEAVPGIPLRPGLVPGRVWAISDADQLHPRVKSASWKMSTLPAPLHTPQRLALFFDGSVDGVAEEALAIPGGL